MQRVPITDYLRANEWLEDYEVLAVVGAGYDPKRGSDFHRDAMSELLTLDYNERRIIRTHPISAGYALVMTDIDGQSTRMFLTPKVDEPRRWPGILGKLPT